MNTQYLGKLYIGSQPALVSFDTGSNWLAVTSNLATASSGSDKTMLAEHKPAYRPSMSRQSDRVSEEIVTEKYGSTQLDGQIWRDQVCLTADDQMCVKNFPFVAIRSESGLAPEMDGILGLGPRLDNFDHKLSLVQNPKSISLINYLKEQDLIKEAIASFSLSSQSSRSYVQFGERNMTQAQEDKLMSFELVSNDYWAIDVEHFLYDYDMPKF